VLTRVTDQQKITAGVVLIINLSGQAGAAVQHLYDEIGVYQAVVTATNTENSISASTLVTITAMPDCLRFEFGEANEIVTFYVPVSKDFDSAHNMAVDSVATHVKLGDQDSDAKTLHIQVRRNGESFYTCNPVVDTTLSYHDCSGGVDVDLLKGDTVTFYLYGSGSPQGIIGGPNTLELCSVPFGERVYLPIIIR
jgi:hypothetical protein